MYFLLNQIHSQQTGVYLPEFVIFAGRPGAARKKEAVVLLKVSMERVRIGLMA